MIVIISALGGGFVALEVICYINLYIFVYQHDKNISILNPSIIQSRHRTNAIRLFYDKYGLINSIVFNLYLIERIKNYYF
jgi:hypothetical protein